MKLVNEKCLNAVNLRLNKSLVLFGYSEQIRIDAIFGFILNLSKQYIYKCKQEEQVPNVNIFCKKLAYRYKIEEYNAKLKMDLHNFTVKWLPYVNLFENNN